ncbi:Hsp70 family protein [Plantactinospora sp. KLBMP9567]|uniref:Hsp70 family protein n=1 Tax=Plantactinospora sp. KLBMP9567 TaxID=3085900 RepID=UPI0029825AFB|nr:Hsp70 family protein [Plantactinospora sp. KLBMP9567]MDW5324766.1 Hsp70 family protein [Plantactinospora sp. KLBMP9567]
MRGAGARLGIDFGTYNTVAVLALPDREPRPLLFDGSPLLRSAVCADTGERLLVGQDALHTALSLPQSYEPYPKRCVDEGTVLLGGREMSVEELFAAPLRRVASEVRLITTEPVTEAVLTYPAAWGTHRRGTLLAAANKVLPTVRLVAEPVAAANFFVEVAGRDLPVGRCAVVYDFGAGTFDVTVVRRNPDGFEVLATEGLADCGGLDIDAAIVARIGTAIGSRDERLWARLTSPDTTSDRRASQQLWANARSGKEMLTRTTATLIHVPLFDVDMPLGREELEELAAPVVARTVTTTRTLLGRLDDGESAVAAVFLSGGSSRMPAVATALHRALDIAPSVVEQPELVVAEGSLRIPVGSGGPATVGATAELPTAGPATAAAGAGTPGRRFGRWAALSRSRRVQVAGAAVAVAAVLVTATVAAAVAGGGDPVRGTEDSAGAAPASASATPGASGSPRPSVTPTVTAAGVDACMVGTWRSLGGQSDKKIDNQSIQFSGGAGTVQTYTADGKVTLNFNKTTDKTATYRGVKWRERTRGTASANVYHRNGVEYVSGVRAKGTIVLYRGSSRNASVPLSLLLEPTEYICTGDTMRFFGNGPSEWVRVR